MTITVVIPVYNHKDLFVNGLLAIRKQLVPVDEVIIGDDATDEYSVAEVAREVIPDCHIVRLEPPKFFRRAQTVNACMFISTGDIIHIMDQGMLCDEHYFEQIREYHKRYDNLLVRPRIHWMGGVFVERHPWSTPNKLVDYVGLLGGNVSFLRKWLYKTEGLNNTFTGFSDDDREFGAVCAAVGMRIIQAEQILYHLPHPQSLTHSIRNTERKGRVLRKILENQNVNETNIT